MRVPLVQVAALKLCVGRQMSSLLQAALLTVLLQLSSVSIQAEPLERLVDPRPAAHHLDTTGRVDTQIREDIAAIAAALQESGKGEIVVVAIRSVDGKQPRSYATELFNRWGIGSSERHDGILVLAALDDRKAEIVLGDGVDGDAEVRASERIMQDTMLPHFRDGSPDLALVAGARACAEQILKLQLSPEKAPEYTQLQQPQPVISEESQSGTGSIVAYTAGGAGGGLFSIIGVRAWLRRRPRKCPGCQSRMVQLGEVDDDSHLQPGEKVEEQLGSVDYDVWSCPSCSHTLKLRYGAVFTRYANCPGCTHKTLSSSSRTITAATYSSGGLVEVSDKCGHCQHNRTYTRSTPQLQRSSSSSSSGGGRSSGRGSSGSW